MAEHEDGQDPTTDKVPVSELIPPSGSIGLIVDVVLGGLVAGGCWYTGQAGTLSGAARVLVEPYACVLHGVFAAVMLYLARQGVALLGKRGVLSDSEWVEGVLTQVREQIGLRQTDSLLAEGIRLQEQDWRDRLDERWSLALVVGWLIGCGWLMLATLAPAGLADLGGLTARLQIGLVEAGLVFVAVPGLAWSWRRLLRRWSETTRKFIKAAAKDAVVVQQGTPATTPTVGGPAAKNPVSGVGVPVVVNTPVKGPVSRPATGPKKPFSRDYK